jgi:HK97 family phage major capsid protein
MRLDPRQYGMRPVPPQYGMRQTRQYGMRKPRQYGMRPEMLEGQAAATLDADEWTADVTMLFCAASAVVRLGARLVFGGDVVPVPALPFAGPAYNRPGQAKAIAHAAPTQILRPQSHELAVTVSLPTQLARQLAERPDVAWAIKEDLAYALALAADGAFLRGPGPLQPTGLDAVVPVTPWVEPAAGGRDLLATARAMLAELRGVGPGASPLPRPPFRNAGWVLAPHALQDLAALQTDTGLAAGAAGRGPRTLDDTDLLAYDGQDGGVLLGYPYFVSEAAGAARRMFFSADWGEAWIALDGGVVSVDFSPDSGFGTNQIVLRAVMHHDFIVRRPSAFRRTR